MDVKWIEFFAQLGLTTIGQILLLIVIGFFGKQLIVYFFSENIELKKLELNRDLEAFKQSLNSETENQRHEMNKILETHRSELNLTGIKNSKLHDRQLQIVADLYKRIVILERSFREMTSFMKHVYQDAEKEELERVEKASSAYNDYLSFYTENRIFFSESTAENLDKLRKHFFDSHWDYTYTKRFNSTDHKTNMEKYERSAKVVSEEIPAVLKQLDEEFRDLLTVNIKGNR